MSGRTEVRSTAEEEDNNTIAEQVYTLAKSVPSGRVMSYGALGARCQPPISGYICGRIMRSPNDDAVPWWRIVAKSGALPIIKRNPDLADEQRERLESEGVRFKGDRIDMGSFAID